MSANSQEFWRCILLRYDPVQEAQHNKFEIVGEDIVDGVEFVFYKSASSDEAPTKRTKADFLSLFEKVA